MESCGLPYLPVVFLQVALHLELINTMDGLAGMILVFMVAAAIALGNLIAGPLLLSRLDGGRRASVAAGFVIGGVIPTTVAALAVFLSESCSRWRAGRCMDLPSRK